MRTLAILIAFFTLTTCITPVNLEPDDPDDILVIDGFITDQEGPFEIVVQKISRYAGTLQGGTEIFEKNAEVFITDQNGTRTNLGVVGLTRTDIGNGCPPGCCSQVNTVNVESLGYRTPAGFKGVVGSTYMLNVTLFNGRRYQSTPQTMIATPEIDSVSYKFRRLPSIDPVTVGSGVDIFATWKDPAEVKNFYSWRVNGTYRIETPPNGGCCLYMSNGDGTLCWINEKNVEGNVLAFSDERFNGTEITNRVGFIEDDGLRFSSKSIAPSRQYYIEIEQSSVPGEAFAFNRLFASQLEIDGDIFDPPPAQINGNFRSLNNPDETVIGYFGAYSVKKKGIFIDRADLESVQRFPNLCGDCRIRAGATQQVPDVYR